MQWRTTFTRRLARCLAVRQTKSLVRRSEPPLISRSAIRLVYGTAIVASRRRPCRGMDVHNDKLAEHFTMQNRRQNLTVAIRFPHEETERRVGEGAVVRYVLKNG